MKSAKIKNKKIFSFPVIIQRDEDGYFVGRVPDLKSCYTQAKTLPELYKRLQEIVSLCVNVEKEYFGEKVTQNQFIGIQQLEFSI